MGSEMCIRDSTHTHTHTHTHVHALKTQRQTDRQLQYRRRRHNNKLINLIFQTLTFVDVGVVVVVVGDALDYVLQFGQRLCCRLDFFVVHLAADAAVANSGQSALQASFKENDACLRPARRAAGG